MTKAPDTKVRTSSLEQLEARAMLHGGHGPMSGGMYGSMLGGDAEPSRFGSFADGERQAIRSEPQIDAEAMFARRTEFSRESWGGAPRSSFGNPWVSTPRVRETTTVIIVLTPQTSPAAIAPPAISPLGYSLTPASSRSATTVGSVSSGNPASNSSGSNNSSAASHDSLSRLVSNSTAPVSPSSNLRPEKALSATALPLFVSFSELNDYWRKVHDAASTPESTQLTNESQPDANVDQDASTTRALSVEVTDQQPETGADDSEELLELSADGERNRQKRKSSPLHSSLPAIRIAESMRNDSVFANRQELPLNQLLWQSEAGECLTFAADPDLIELLATDMRPNLESSKAWNDSPPQLEATLGISAAIELLADELPLEETDLVVDAAWDPAAVAASLPGTPAQ